MLGGVVDVDLAAPHPPPASISEIARSCLLGSGRRLVRRLSRAAAAPPPRFTRLRRPLFARSCDKLTDSSISEIARSCPQLATFRCGVCVGSPGDARRARAERRARRPLFARRRKRRGLGHLGDRALVPALADVVTYSCVGSLDAAAASARARLRRRLFAGLRQADGLVHLRDRGAAAPGNGALPQRRRGRRRPRDGEGEGATDSTDSTKNNKYVVAESDVRGRLSVPFIVEGRVSPRARARARAKRIIASWTHNNNVVHARTRALAPPRSAQPPAGRRSPFPTHVFAARAVEQRCGGVGQRACPQQQITASRKGLGLHRVWSTEHNRGCPPPPPRAWLCHRGGFETGAAPLFSNLHLRTARARYSVKASSISCRRARRRRSCRTPDTQHFPDDELFSYHWVYFALLHPVGDLTGNRRVGAHRERETLSACHPSAIAAA